MWQSGSEVFRLTCKHSHAGAPSFHMNIKLMPAEFSLKLAFPTPLVLIAQHHQHGRLQYSLQAQRLATSA